MIKNHSEKTGDQIFLIPEEIQFSTKWVLMTYDADARILAIRPYPPKNLNGLPKKVESISNDWEKHVFPFTKKERKEVRGYQSSNGL
jgi:hypothetical protein